MILPKNLPPIWSDSLLDHDRPLVDHCRPCRTTSCFQGPGGPGPWKIRDEDPPIWAVGPEKPRGTDRWTVVGGPGPQWFGGGVWRGWKSTVQKSINIQVDHSGSMIFQNLPKQVSMTISRVASSCLPWCSHHFIQRLPRPDAQVLAHQQAQAECRRLERRLRGLADGFQRTRWVGRVLARSVRVAMPVAPFVASLFLVVWPGALILAFLSPLKQATNGVGPMGSLAAGT